MNVAGGLGKQALEFLDVLARKAAGNYPYDICNGLTWMNKFKGKVMQIRLTAAMAHTVHLSLEESLVKAKGKHMHNSSYRAAFRHAGVRSYM